IHDSDIFVAGKGICISHNDGKDWYHEKNCCGLLDFGIATSLALSDSNIYMSSADYNGERGGGVLCSTNNGITWSNMNNDTTNFNWGVNALTIYDGKIFAGRDSGIWISDTSFAINNI